MATFGFATVFAELRKYGYDEVEFAGYSQGSAGPITLAELKRLTRDNGLRGIGSHVGYYSSDPNAYTFAQNLDQVLDDAQALGLPHIGTASGPWRYGATVDGWKRCAEEFNHYGAEAKKRGMKFYQHNHAEEFSFATDRPNVRLYDVLLAETDPDLVHLEMDIYWAYVAQFRFSRRVDGTPAPSTRWTTYSTSRTAIRSSTSRTANATTPSATATAWRMSGTETSTIGASSRR